MVALGALCGTVAYRRAGALAATTAVGVVLFTPATLRACARAQSETLLALLLCAAWVTWYSAGQQRKRWLLAWAGAMAFVILATFTAGARAIVLFYLPFLFLRRPVRGRRRLLLPSHIAVLAVGAVVVVTWLRWVPGQIFLPWNELTTVPQVTRSYPVEVVLFPLVSILYLMPWPFLMWPAFCMAYRPLETIPVAFHYLRTIVLAVLIAGWLIPDASPLALLPLLGPLAIMTALHADLLVRRHHRELRRLGLALHGAAAVVAALGLLIGLLHLSGGIRIEGMPFGTIAWADAALLAMLTLAALGLRGPLRRLPSHQHLLSGFAALACAVVTLDTAWSSWSAAEQRAAGLALAGSGPAPEYLVVRPAANPDIGAAAAPAADPDAAPPGTAPGTPTAYRPLQESVVYRQTRGPHRIACFYLGRPVLRVTDPKTQIPLPVPGPRQVIGDPVAGPPTPTHPGGPTGSPVYRDAVYALCDSGPPVLPEVEWVPLTPPLDLRRRQTVLWQWFPGGLTLLRLHTEALPVPPDYQPEPVRLYRGTRR